MRLSNIWFFFLFFPPHSFVLKWCYYFSIPPHWFCCREYVKFLFIILNRIRNPPQISFHFIILYCFGRISWKKIFQLRKRKHLNCKKEILFMKISFLTPAGTTWCIHFYDTTTHHCHHHHCRQTRTKNEQEKKEK